MTLLNTAGRHTSITQAARRFEMDHLTNPEARQIATSVARLAQEMLARVKTDDPELTKALDKLADARDGFIRAAIYGGI
jgi:uncharacterized membrane protein affecting hemolysin expression